MEALEEEAEVVVQEVGLVAEAPLAAKAHYPRKEEGVTDTRVRL